MRTRTVIDGNAFYEVDEECCERLQKGAEAGRRPGKASFREAAGPSAGRSDRRPPEDARAAGKR